MQPLSFKVNFLVDTFSLVVNEQIDTPYEFYGLVLNVMKKAPDTIIYLHSMYDKDDLAGYVLNINLSFTLAG